MERKTLTRSNYAVCMETWCLVVQNNSKTEYVSMVTLCTNPPQFYNGIGPTPNEAGDTAAVDALQKLSEVGLEGLCGQGLAGLPGTESSARSVAGRSLRCLFCLQTRLLNKQCGSRFALAVSYLSCRKT